MDPNADFLDRPFKRLCDWARKLGVSPKVMHRWRSGVGGRRLLAHRLGGRWIVYDDDMRRFIERADDSPPAAPPRRTDQTTRTTHDLENSGW